MNGLPARNAFMKCLMLGFAIATFAGCGGPSPELTKKSAVITWPALQSLQNPDVARGIILTAQMGDMAGLKKNAADPKFQGLVDTFAAEPIPSSMASPGRETAKKDVVEIYKKIIEGAKAGTNAKEMKATVASLTKALGVLTDPNLK